MSSPTPSSSRETLAMPATMTLAQRLKRWLGPIYRQKSWLERVQYWPRSIANGQAGHDLVRQQMASGAVAIGKLGESELRGLACYLKHRDTQGHCATWDDRSQRLYTNAGVFPATPEGFSRFGREYVNALPELDTLAVWYNRGEARVVNAHAPQAQLVGLNAIEPHLWQHPWLSLFANKRVLAISPFAKTIEYQHTRLPQIWQQQPEMAVDYDLATIETPLCAALVDSPYPTWGEGLDRLRDQMAAIDFDLAIIGAGAWSLPLAVHAKRLGKVGIHLGGPAQLVFGILGQRWEQKPNHARFFNEHWVRPGQQERPDSFTKIEGGCYW